MPFNYFKSIVFALDIIILGIFIKYKDFFFSYIIPYSIESK